MRDSDKLRNVCCFDCCCSLWFVAPSCIWVDDGLGHTFGIFLLFCNPWLNDPLSNKVDNDDHVVNVLFFSYILYVFTRSRERSLPQYTHRMDVVPLFIVS